MGSTGDVGRREEKLQLVICCSSRGKTEGLGPGEQRDRREGLWVSYLAFWRHHDLLSISQYLASMCSVTASFPSIQRLSGTYLRCYGRV